VVPFRIHERQPFAILEMTLDIERFLGRVVLVAVDMLELGRCGDRDDMFEMARVAVDDREPVYYVQRHTGVALPRASFGHLFWKVDPESRILHHRLTAVSCWAIHVPPGRRRSSC